MRAYIQTLSPKSIMAESSVQSYWFCTGWELPKYRHQGAILLSSLNIIWCGLNFATKEIFSQMNSLCHFSVLYGCFYLEKSLHMVSVIRWLCRLPGKQQQPIVLGKRYCLNFLFYMFLLLKMFLIYFCSS